MNSKWPDAAKSIAMWIGLVSCLYLITILILNLTQAYHKKDIILQLTADRSRLATQIDSIENLHMGSSDKKDLVLALINKYESENDSIQTNDQVRGEITEILKGFNYSDNEVKEIVEKIKVQTPPQNEEGF